MSSFKSGYEELNLVQVWSLGQILTAVVLNRVNKIESNFGRYTIVAVDEIAREVWPVNINLLRA